MTNVATEIVDLKHRCSNNENTTVKKEELTDLRNTMVGRIADLQTIVMEIEKKDVDNKIENATIRADVARIKTQIQDNNREIKYLKPTKPSKNQMLNMMSRREEVGKKLIIRRFGEGSKTEYVNWCSMRDGEKKNMSSAIFIYAIALCT